MSNDLKKLIFAILGFSILLRIMKSTTPGTSLADLVKKFEGASLKAYRDISGIWTIGYGLTSYPSGKKVAQGDTITQKQADSYFQQVLQKFAQGVEDSVKVPVNNNQFAALVSFAYNVGLGAFRKSTLLKKVNANPKDESIRAEFMKWVNAGGKPSRGLTNRRRIESDLYFS